MVQFIEKTLMRMAPIALLLVRLLLAVIFVQSGWGKLQHMERTIEFVNSLNIPYAQYQAPFVALVELVGGLALAFGLFTRLAAVPLIVTMFVALFTAQKEELKGISETFSLSETHYALMLFVLATVGAGAFSLDRLVRKTQ